MRASCTEYLDKNTQKFRDILKQVKDQLDTSTYKNTKSLKVMMTLLERVIDLMELERLCMVADRDEVLDSGYSNHHFKELNDLLIVDKNPLNSFTVFGREARDVLGDIGNLNTYMMGDFEDMDIGEIEGVSSRVYDIIRN